MLYFQNITDFLCPMNFSGNAKEKNSQGLNNNDYNSINEYFKVQNNII